MKLTDREWNEFKIGDLFHVNGSYTTKPQDLIMEGNTPRITCSATNNGLDGFYKNEVTEKGGVLTVDSATVGYISYQGYSFIATDHVEKIEADIFIPKEIGLFLVSAFSNSCGNKYNYGYKFSQQRIKRQTVMLPVTKKGEPDYEFMRNYVDEIKKQKLKEYVTYCRTEIGEIGDFNDIKSLDEMEWKPFYIKEIFNNPKRGKRIIEENHINGNTALVSSYGRNNGVTNFIGNDTMVKFYDNCLSIANGGSSAGKAFYHPYRFIASDHVTQCWNKKLTKYQYLFLATVMTKALMGKYSFSHEISDPRMAKEKIMLPTKKNGQPDFEYM